MKLLIMFVAVLTIFLNVSESQGDCGTQSVRKIIVDQSGNGDFKTVQSAIDAVPESNAQWITIFVKQGIYKEQVTIPYNKPCIYLQGSGRRVTKITFDAHENTDISATFTSSPDNVVARYITFENSYNLGAGQGGHVLKQALAARIYGDKSAFFECGFVGLQDTLWDVRNRHYFNKCYIEGAIDFIFGRGQSIYEECLLHATVGSLPSSITSGVVTAQGRSEESDTGGFYFLKGAITSTGPVNLGRAYGKYSRVIFHETSFPDTIKPEGWDAWNVKDYVNQLTYAEVDCSGPGSDKSKRVSWVKNWSRTDLNSFSMSNFIDKEGWIARLPSYN